LYFGYHITFENYKAQNYNSKTVLKIDKQVYLLPVVRVFSVLKFDSSCQSFWCWTRTRRCINR